MQARSTRTPSPSPGATARSPPPINLGAGEFTIPATSHHYLDDKATGPDSYTITVTVADDDSGSVSGTTSVNVNNAPPASLNLVFSATSINENGSTTLSGTFTDAGTLDTHTVSINWGDGSVTPINLGAGVLSIPPTSHTYLDDILTGPDTYTITVRVTDNSGDFSSKTTSVTVNNVAPTMMSLRLASTAISENGTATLLGSFIDPGTLDSHQLVVHWGDSTTTTHEIVAGATSFSVSHPYLDNPASGTTYPITATLTDKDGGVFSITESPTLLQSLSLPTGPQPGARFGSAVATDTNFRVVGAPYADVGGLADVGQAFIYNAITGALVATLQNPNPTPASGDLFGYSVAVSGNTVVVGAPGDNTRGTDAGAAYVFSATTGALITLNATPASGDQFGYSVGVSGNTVVVGAPFADEDGAADAGSAHIFNAATGAFIATMDNPSIAAVDIFGISVAVSGNTVVVGASGDDTSAVNAGAAYLFNAITGDFVTPVNASPASGDKFGQAVAISGNLVVVGAPADNKGGVANDAGSAHLFSAATGARTATLDNPAIRTNDNFGVSVAVSANTVVIGAFLDDTGASNAGSAYVFDPTGEFIATVNNPTPGDGDQFGFSVAVAGNTIVVGAGYDDTDNADQGGAYVIVLGTTVKVKNVAPVPTITGAPATCVEGTALTLTGAATDVSSVDHATLTLKWNLIKNGIPFGRESFSTGFNFTPDSPGNYAVTLTATDKDGGSNTTTKAISVTIKTLPFYDPNPAAGNRFGHTIVPLSTGNVVITSPYDDAGGEDAGAVYLFNGANGSQISVVRGSHPGDQIGLQGVTVVGNGNYVVSSAFWDNGATTNAGAVTFGSGITGVNGMVVNSSNSLVGASTDDFVGYSGSFYSAVTMLSNGNYVVISPYWNNAGKIDLGAVTFGFGGSGVKGAIDSTNSLIGTTANDRVGYNGMAALANCNYVVNSPYWHNFQIQGNPQVGAVTWRSGSGGSNGSVGFANSLIGSTEGDFVGSGGVTPLTNGNYVVSSPSWDTPGKTDVGAVTWRSGISASTGSVSTGNSLYGSTANDQVGSGGVTALSNGNFVVTSPNWGNVGKVNVGAVTWATGSASSNGTFSSSNSLVGSTPGDNVGSGGVTALTNGNYVVSSPNWDNAGNSDVGAVTWATGSNTFGTTVNSSNSLVGTTAYERVGSGGVTALTDGNNYVVSSPSWHNFQIPGNPRVGAVTWRNGSGDVNGSVASANSLIGSTEGDFVGSGGVTALTNGNYVVSSPSWDTPGKTDVGAVTWRSGISASTGSVSTGNSLYGSTANDQVGNGGVMALSNGNFVVTSPNWDNAGNSDVGAVTWATGSSGTGGSVSTNNSLYALKAYSFVGSGGVKELANGNYVVNSPYWDSGLPVNAGAVSYGSGSNGIKGLVSSLNSLVGQASNANLQPVVVDNVNKTFFGRFVGEGEGKVRAGFFTYLNGGGAAQNGYLVGATAFFDVNMNAVLDPNEPSSLTDATGAFQVQVPSVYDTNGNGELDDGEGQWVVFGGIDSSTGLPAVNKLIAPASWKMLTPLTTLVSTLVANYGLSTADAAQRVEEALGLPDVDLGTLNPIAETLAGNTSAPEIFAAHAQVQDTIAQALAVFAGASGGPAQDELATSLMSTLAAQIVAAGSTLDLNQASAITAILEAAEVSTGVTLEEEIVAGAATVIAATNQQIEDIPAGTSVAFLTQVAQVKQVAQGSVADDLGQVGSGDKDIDDAVADNTGSALSSQVDAAAIPPTITAPASFGVEATSAAGVVVSFAVTATNLTGGSEPVICNPASGSVFPLGTTIVICTSTDSAGNSSSTSFTVTVTKMALSISLPEAATVDEGSLYTLLLGPAEGFGQDTIASFTIHWGDGQSNTFNGLPNGQSPTHAYADGASNGTERTIVVDLTDAEGTTTLSAGMTTVTITNAAPAVVLTGPATGSLYAVNTVVNFAAGYNDPGTLDTHTAQWQFGPHTQTGTVTPDLGGGSGAVSGSYSFTTAGVYPAKLTVTDDDGGAGEASTIGTPALDALVVVYDPSAGFVTGGGWIDSPQGAYRADLGLVGRANFGFVAKYQKGATTPTGQTEFQFKVGSLNFHSSSYDWLVVAGARAIYKGTGTINGVGTYGFTLTAIDGQVAGGGGVDKFRIRIWDKSGGADELNDTAVVYDNQFGVRYDGANATAIGGGSIIIHTKPLQAAGSPSQVGSPAVLTQEMLQPIAAEAIARWQAAGASAAELDLLRQVEFQIVDLEGQYLGMSSPTIVTIDQDGAGHGWFVDASPASAVAGRIDLLSVVAHELGHVLGLEHSEEGLMAETLATGVRHEVGVHTDKEPVLVLGQDLLAAALGQFMDEWNRRDLGLVARTDYLLGVGNGALVLNPLTLPDEGVADVPTDSAGQGGVKDKPTDDGTFEALFSQDLDFINTP